jgi:hypothetical protein
MTTVPYDRGGTCAPAAGTGPVEPGACAGPPLIREAECL